jgi:hypothetical protein
MLIWVVRRGEEEVVVVMPTCFGPLDGRFLLSKARGSRSNFLPALKRNVSS